MLDAPVAKVYQAILDSEYCDSMSLTKFFLVATQFGANPVHFSPIWQYSDYARRVESALQDGNLRSVMALIATLPLSIEPQDKVALEGAIVNVAHSAYNRARKKLGVKDFPSTNDVIEALSH